MASLNFDNFCAGAFRHGPLSVGRNHFVLRRNEVPTGLGFPRWFAHHSAECLHAPWNLRIGHESGHTRIYIGGERGRELGPVQREEPVLRRVGLPRLAAPRRALCSTFRLTPPF